MIVMRPATQHDIDDVVHLAEESGIGLTSLIPNKRYIENLIDKSANNFSCRNTSGKYFFVLEVNAKVVGCSAIHVRPGFSDTFYTYKIIRKNNGGEVLEMVNDLDQETELCSLFLLTEYRNKMNGYLLSYARFLYMALHLKNFTKIVFAEVRGVSNDEGVSPFWEAVGRHYYKMDYQEADQLTGLGQKEFIAKLAHKGPLSLSALSPVVKAVIGIPHEKSKAAVKLLEKQNFSYTEYVDIFDAGPTLIVDTLNINSIKQAKRCSFIEGEVIESGETYMIASVGNHFRATAQAIKLEEDGNIRLSSETIETLMLTPGDEVIIAPLFQRGNYE